MKLGGGEGITNQHNAEPTVGKLRPKAIYNTESPRIPQMCHQLSLEVEVKEPDCHQQDGNEAV